MKKKLFSLLLLSFFLVGSFCNAGDFSLSRSNYLEPSNCVGNPVISSVGGDLICRNSNYCYNQVSCLGYMFMLPGGLGVTSNITFKAGDFNVICESYPCYVSFNGGTYFEFESPLLPGGTEALSGAILSLSNSVSEFIPYLAYIGIGLLIACIGFVAIKWLINWIRRKILSPFK